MVERELRESRALRPPTNVSERCHHVVMSAPEKKKRARGAARSRLPRESLESKGEGEIWSSD